MYVILYGVLMNYVGWGIFDRLLRRYTEGDSPVSPAQGFSHCPQFSQDAMRLAASTCTQSICRNSLHAYYSVALHCGACGERSPDRGTHPRKATRRQRLCYVGSARSI